MDDKTMTNEENYRFDVAGYMTVPGVLTAAELKACNQALDQLASDGGPLRWTSPACNPLRALREHPVLMRYLEQICGEGFRLDESPRLVESCAEATDLSGGDEWVDWSRAYRQYNGNRFCQGMRAFWALADAGAEDGGLVVVPASHNSTVPAPQDLMDGTDPMELVEQPVLQAGDLLLCTESLMRGLRPWQGAGPQRLLECGYISAAVRPGSGVRNPRRRQRAARVGRRSDRYPARRLAQSQPPVPAASGAFGRRKGLAGRGARDFPSLDLHPRPRFRD